MATPDYLSVITAIRDGGYTDGELRQIYRYITDAYVRRNMDRLRALAINPTRLDAFMRVSLSDTVRPKEIAGAKGIYLRGVGRQNYRGQWTAGLVLLDDEEAYGKFKGDIIRVNPQALTLEKIVT